MVPAFRRGLLKPAGVTFGPRFCQSFRGVYAFSALSEGKGFDTASDHSAFYRLGSLFTNMALQCRVGTFSRRGAGHDFIGCRGARPDPSDIKSTDLKNAKPNGSIKPRIDVG